MKNDNSFQFSAAQATLNVDSMMAALVAAGYSHTAARRAVCYAVCEAAGQASPLDLLARGRLYHPDLGLVTVYRTLEILLALGLVRKLHTEGGCHTYAAVGHHHGHHLICTRCQRVLEFEGCDIERVIDSVEQQTGFEVSSHWLEMFGVCPQCRTALQGAATHD